MMPRHGKTMTHPREPRTQRYTPGATSGGTGPSARYADDPPSHTAPIAPMDVNQFRYENRFPDTVGGTGTINENAATQMCSRFPGMDREALTAMYDASDALEQARTRLAEPPAYERLTDVYEEEAVASDAVAAAAREMQAAAERFQSGVAGADGNSDAAAHVTAEAVRWKTDTPKRDRGMVSRHTAR